MRHMMSQELLVMPKFLELSFLMRAILPVSLFDETSTWLGSSYVLPYHHRFSYPCFTDATQRDDGQVCWSRTNRASEDEVVEDQPCYHCGLRLIARMNLPTSAIRCKPAQKRSRSNESVTDERVGRTSAFFSCCDCVVRHPTRGTHRPPSNAPIPMHSTAACTYSL